MIKNATFLFVLAVSACLIIGAGFFVHHTRQFILYAQSPLGSGDKEAVVSIPQGAGLAQVIAELETGGILNDPLRFRLLARLMRLDKKLKAGEYRLKNDMTPLEVLRKLASGDILLHKLTIPEGYTLKQIAALIEENQFGKADDFLQKVFNKENAAQKGINADSLEGYIFPDTYLFPAKMTLEQMIDVMHSRFREVFTPEWQSQAKALGMTVHEAVTLASIIEKETGAAFERPLISSVFHNRIKRKMRLQSDPTVIYGIPDFDGNITRKHLNTRTPYNTYQIAGMPPGPIASPGADALEAALHPAETDFLYFVGKGDGTHRFSKNLADHQKAVRKYQLKGGK